MKCCAPWCQLLNILQSLDPVKQQKQQDVRQMFLLSHHFTHPISGIRRYLILSSVKHKRRPPLPTQFPHKYIGMQGKTSILVKDKQSTTVKVIVRWTQSSLFLRFGADPNFCLSGFTSKQSHFAWPKMFLVITKAIVFAAVSPAFPKLGDSWSVIWEETWISVFSSLCLGVLYKIYKNIESKMTPDR